MKLEIISLKQALEILNSAHNVDPEKAGRSVYARQTIYNAINQGKLKRYGPRHMAMVNKNEVLSLFGPKRAV